MEGKEISDKDIETIYKAMEDEKMNWLANKMSKPSDVWIFIETAKEMKAQETKKNPFKIDNFLDLLESHSLMQTSNLTPDDNDYIKLMEIYDKYVDKERI